MEATRRVTRLADLLFDAFYSAAVGGSVVAILFLLSDAVTSEPFWTPSLLGSVLFGGMAAEDVTRVDLSMVASFTVVHFVSFGLLGLTISWIVHTVEHFADRMPLVATLVFLALSAGFFTLEVLFAQGAVERIGFLKIVFANLLTAVAMAFFLLRSHRETAHTEEEASGDAKAA